MKIEHMEQQKNKLLVDKSAPDLNDMLCSLCQKNRGEKRKNTHFHFGSLGLPSCLRLNKDIKLFTEIHFEILHINQVNYSKHRLSTHATDDTSHYIADWGLHIFKCHMTAIRDRQNELN